MKNKKLYIIFSILLVLVVIMTVTKQMQNDTFFTIATGNYILQDGYDNMDHLTWHDNLQFYKLRWAFDILIALIYNTFNLTGIYVFVLIIASITAVSLLYILVKQKNNVVISFICSIIAIILLTGNGFFTGRAQIMSYLFLLWEIYCIEQLIETKKKRYYWGLFILSVLIVNFHASVWPMMIIVIMPYLAESILCKILKKDQFIKSKFIIEPINLKLIITAILFMVLGSVLSPIGTYTYSYMFKVIGGISSKIIVELQTTDILSSVGMALSIITTSIILLSTKTKISLRDFFLFLGLYILALMAGRNMAFLYLLGMIPFAKLITNLFKTYNETELLEKLTELSRRTRVLLGITVFLILIFSNNLVTRLREEYVNPKKYPIEATKYIKENLDYANMKIYNNFNYGSYLEFQGIKAFVDSRSEIFTPQFNDTTVLEDWYQTKTGYTNYNDTFEKYGINYALIENNEIINTYIRVDEKYEKVYDDSIFSVYVKK